MLEVPEKKALVIDLVNACFSDTFIAKAFRCDSSIISFIRRQKEKEGCVFTQCGLKTNVVHYQKAIRKLYQSNPKKYKDFKRDVKRVESGHVLKIGVRSYKDYLLIEEKKTGRVKIDNMKRAKETIRKLRLKRVQSL